MRPRLQFGARGKHGFRAKSSGRLSTTLAAVPHSTSIWSVAHGVGHRKPLVCMPLTRAISPAFQTLRKFGLHGEWRSIVDLNSRCYQVDGPDWPSDARPIALTGPDRRS